MGLIFDFQSSLLTLGRADASITLHSLTRSLLRILVELIRYAKKQIGGERHGMHLADATLIDHVGHTFVLAEDVDGL